MGKWVNYEVDGVWLIIWVSGLTMRWIVFLIIFIDILSCPQLTFGLSFFTISIYTRWFFHIIFIILCHMRNIVTGQFSYIGKEIIKSFGYFIFISCCKVVYGERLREIIFCFLRAYSLFEHRLRLFLCFFGDNMSEKYNDFKVRLTLLYIYVRTVTLNIFVCWCFHFFQM